MIRVDSPSKYSKYLRFFYNPSKPAEVNGIFIPERSVCKIPPGRVDYGGEFLSLVFLGDEEHIAKSDYPNKDWRAVKDKPLDYVVPELPNVQNMFKAKDVLVAPPYSRQKMHANFGFHLLFNRGSRAVGVASHIFQELSEEKRKNKHYHKFLEEVYIGLEGKVCLELDGEEIIIGKGDIKIVKPYQIEVLTKVIEPYHGLTLQIPSWSFDKVRLNHKY